MNYIRYTLKGNLIYHALIVLIGLLVLFPFNIALAAWAMMVGTGLVASFMAWRKYKRIQREAYQRLLHDLHKIKPL